MVHTRTMSESWHSRTPAQSISHFARQTTARWFGIPYNERVLFVEVIFQAILSSGAITFLGIFLVRLDAPTFLVGLYTSLPALVTILTALPIGSYVQCQRDLVATANRGRVVYRSTVALFAMLPLLPAPIAPYALVAVYSLISVPGSVSNMAITSILGIATSVDRRPGLLSRRLAINGLATSIVALLAGQWLDLAPFPTNYQVLFVIGAAAGLAGIYVLSKIKLPPLRQPTKALARIRPRELVTLVRSTPGFRNYAIASFFFRIALSMPAPLYTIYRVRNVGASDGWIGILLTVESFVSVFAYFALARLVNRPKFQRWFWLSCPLTLLYPLTMALATTPTELLIPTLMSGLFGAAMNVFMANSLYQVLPERSRTSFVSANVLLINITGFAAPMFGAVLGDLVGLRTALVVVACLRVVTGLSFWLLRVGAEPTPSPATPALSSE